jgi:hypothetical protein
MSAFPFSATIGAFDEARLLVAAARRLRELGYRELDAYMPHALPELDEALGIRRTRLRWWVLAAGLFGVGFAFLVQWWCNAFDYPVLVGGRPFDSVPTDVPIMFETGVLFAGMIAFVAMLFLSRMPRLWSPVIDLPGYERTSVDRFWIVIRYPDPAWTTDLPARLLDLGALEVRIVGEVP